VDIRTSGAHDAPRYATTRFTTTMYVKVYMLHFLAILCGVLTNGRTPVGVCALLSLSERPDLSLSSCRRALFISSSCMLLPF
jgi:hypothetical protein